MTGGMPEGMTGRGQSRRVFCGGVPIGGGAPIPIQSMTNTSTEDAEATAAQIAALAAAGCDIVRCAAPTREAARALPDIRARLAARGVSIPIVADIHFDHRVALAAIEAGADKIRINPGNIGGRERLKAVVDAAGSAGIPIRIGVNGGSLEEGLRVLYETNPAEALAESALRHIDLVRGMGFEGLVVSVKSSDVLINTEAHRRLAAATDLPLHIGVTEAGFGDAAVVKSAAGIGALLAMGIGDTVRVSLTGDPVREIAAARGILRAVNLLPGQITLISCPTCGRCRVDLSAICGQVAGALRGVEEERIRGAKRVFRGGESTGTGTLLLREAGGAAALRPIIVAVMGCAVNGPGEASHADLGVACGADGGVYFERGVRKGAVAEDEIAKTVLAGVQKLINVS
ncbi:MAG: flavodoxin-dependent (E)-4-hydroxy-3-methylbut-2-enyl-diphosphate synthase [Clostridiales Family XIII bacterium]|nr:flavodoxin-dependent (E)-4-hydroxy-3-methylbut-2-enyl-diphosphate synthase [Clostridiales Family XIII bacterium]